MVDSPAVVGPPANLNYTAEEFLNNLGFTARSPADQTEESTYGSCAQTLPTDRNHTKNTRHQTPPWSPNPTIWLQGSSPDWPGTAYEQSTKTYNEQFNISQDSFPVPPLPPTKSVTCYFWVTQGYCKWSNEDCLFAHYDTGKVSRAPLQTLESRQAVVGRNDFNLEPFYSRWRKESQKAESRNETEQEAISPKVQRQLLGIKAKYQVNASSPHMQDGFHCSQIGSSRTRTSDDFDGGDNGNGCLIATPRSADLAVCDSSATDHAGKQGHTFTHHGEYGADHPPGRGSYYHGPSYVNQEPVINPQPENTWPQPTVTPIHFHQRNCPHPSDHLNHHLPPNTTTKDESPRILYIQNQVLLETCRGVNSAIDTLMDAVRKTAYEVHNLVMLSKDRGCTIQHPGFTTSHEQRAGMSKATWENGRAREHRQQLMGVAENLSHVMQLQAEEYKRLKEVQRRVSGWMTSFNANSQLPEELVI